MKNQLEQYPKENYERYKKELKSLDLAAFLVCI